MTDVRKALGSTLPVSEEDVEGRAAAVAAVLRDRGGRLEVLFIRRAKRRGDPWSGHMAWPGGKREPGDASLLACAVRETLEELGLDLAERGELIGALRGYRSKGTRATGLRVVNAYVFAVEGDPQLTRSGEVQEAVWIPLAYFTGWRSRRPWRWGASWLPAVPLAYRYQGRLVWGLTLWMLADLLARLAPPRETPAGAAVGTAIGRD